MNNDIYDFAEKIRYYKELYVAMKQKPGYINLGFMTHYENNKSFHKRKETADSWAENTEYMRDPGGNLIVDNTTPYNRYIRCPVITPITISNEPTAGFRVSNNVIRRYSTSNVVWRVEDPRGFELEIASENLNYLIQEQGIGKAGLVGARCIWARVGNNNYLIPEGTIHFPL